MPYGTFLDVSSAEIEIGHAYALDKHGVDLSREMLRTVSNQIGSLRLSGMRFVEAREKVLRAAVTERTRQGFERRRAYSAAVGKIFSSRRAYAVKARKAPRKAIPSVLDAKTGQFEFVLQF